MQLNELFEDKVNEISLNQISYAIGNKAAQAAKAFGFKGQPAAKAQDTYEVPTGLNMNNPETGKPWTPSELKVKYRNFDPTKDVRKAELARLRHEAELEKLKDTLKASITSRDDQTKKLAKTFISKGGLQTNLPSVVPTTDTTTPGAVLTPAEIRAQKQKAVAAQLAPMSSKSTAVPNTPVTAATPATPAPTPAPAWTGKQQKISSPPKSGLPSAQELELLDKKIHQALARMGMGVSESLTWSKNFDPSRSLYRKIKSH